MVRLKVVAVVSQELKTDLKIYLLFRNETHRFSSRRFTDKPNQEMYH